MNTFFAIMAEYETAHIPVEKCAHLFGMSPKKACEAAGRQRLPIPTFRLGSQKSPWLIDAKKLAEYLDDQKIRAEDEWHRLN
ncbi:pyocin activator PrtN family protein [Delftia acidovorans]